MSRWRRQSSAELVGRQADRSHASKHGNYNRVMRRAGCVVQIVILVAELISDDELVDLLFVGRDWNVETLPEF